MEPTNGKMEECITDTTLTTRSTVLVFMFGSMAAHIWATGHRANKIMRESTFCPMEALERGSMKETIEKNGFKFLKKSSLSTNRSSKQPLMKLPRSYNSLRMLRKNLTR